jgi:predicted DNA-binding transcriptional regulator
VTYYCIAKNIIFLKGSVESKIRVFFAWTLSANIVQKGWLKKVNFYALNSLAPVEPLGAKDSVFSSKSLSLFKAKA